MIQVIHFPSFLINNIGSAHTQTKLPISLVPENRNTEEKDKKLSINAVYDSLQV